MYIRSDSTAECVAEQTSNVPYLPCDNAPVTVLRKKPGQSERKSTEKKMGRGGKVEGLHVVQGEFANGGSHPTYAHALTMEGVVRYSERRQQEADFHAGRTDTDIVSHHSPWLRD